MLERGKALIISGPAGSGKTRKALELAIAHGGKYSHATWGFINEPFGMAHALAELSQIVIVDEVVPDAKFFEFAKVLASEEYVEVQPKGKDTHMARNPIWIFLTNKPVVLPEGTRRFNVITLSN